MNKIEAAAVAHVPAGAEGLCTSVAEPPVAAAATTWTATTIDTHVTMWAVTILGGGYAERPMSADTDADQTVRGLLSARREALR